MWNLNYDTNELIYETGRLTDIEDLYCCQQGGKVEEGWSRRRVSRCTLVYIGWINKVPMGSTGNY